MTAHRDLPYLKHSSFLHEVMVFKVVTVTTTHINVGTF